MIRVAFASTDGEHVDLHFGAAESLVLYDVAPGEAKLAGIGKFVQAVMKGENKDKGLARDQQGVSHVEVPRVEDYPPLPADKPPEDKVLAKLDFVRGCAAVYAASIGTSSIKRLMMAGVQPIIVDNGHDIVDLLNEVSLAQVVGGLAWVEKAMARPKDENRFAAMAAEPWQGGAEDGTGTTHRLITSIDELE